MDTQWSFEKLLQYSNFHKQLPELSRNIYVTGTDNLTWLTGYMLLDTALLLGKYLTDKYIHYIIQDERDKHILDMFIGSTGNLLNISEADIFLQQGVGDMPKEVSPFVNDLFNNSTNPLIGIIVEKSDLNSKEINICIELLHFFQNI